MSNPFFRFKQFTVFHDRCAMKVGTDGVLLGAWVPDGPYRRILDVGTGTGLIALMMAQRYKDASVDAVEVDEDAALQARDNVMASPFRERVRVWHKDFMEFESHEAYDLIVSNPPFYADDLKNPDPQRSMARHSGSLNYESLLERSFGMLSMEGQIALVVPSQCRPLVLSAAFRNHLEILRETVVRTKSGKPAKRLLLLLSRCGVRPRIPIQDELLLLSDDGARSEAYQNLTRDFYL